MTKLTSRSTVGGALAVLLMLVVCGPATAPAAAASPVVPKAAADRGTFVVVSDTQNVVAVAGNDVVIAEVMTLQYVTGRLIGPATDSGTFVVHPDGSFEGGGIEACGGCTVDSSVPGDFTAVYEFHGAGDTYTGHLDVMSGSGSLVGLHGGGDFAGIISTNAHTYHSH